jgi:hypothetical protein
VIFGGTDKRQSAHGKRTARECNTLAIIAVMDLSMIVEEIDAEIHRLESVRALLTGKTAPLKRGAPRRAPREVSSESRARMAEGQKKRWAKFHEQ